MLASGRKRKKGWGEIGKIRALVRDKEYGWAGEERGSTQQLWLGGSG